MSTPDRRGMLDPADERLSIRRQCELIGIARSGFYRTAVPIGDADLAVMNRLDALFTDRPFYGSRRMTLQLRHEGHTINRKRVQRLMRRIGIAALGPKPNTSKPAPGHKIYPYLLRDLRIERPNQVWCADITYLPIGRGFLYLVAVMDWSSRAVLSWRLSNTMDASFCVAALEDALARHGRPEIFNTDQGGASQRLRHAERVLEWLAEGANSRDAISPAPSSEPASGFRWTDAGAGWTTCSSSGCGAH